MIDRARYEVQALRVPPDLPLALMDVVIGLIFLAGPDGRTATTTFQIARTLLSWTGAPIRTWGVLFLVAGLLVALGVCRPTRHVVTAIRILGPTLFVMWAMMLVLSALESPTAAIAGIPSYAYLAYRHSIAPAVARRRE